MATIKKTGNAKLDEQIEKWLLWDKSNPETTKEINDLLESNDIKTLEKLLMKRISFGTAGLRGPMRAGFSCMNNLTVQQASQGLCLSVLELVPEAVAKGVVIGYDGRHHSKEFADITTKVFISKGFKTLLYSTTVPTPFVPFCVTHLKCACGVMVTASHNPKQDNGYKVYWDNGCQIVSPIDATIATKINENLVPWDLSAVKLDVATDPLETVSNLYYEFASKSLHFISDEENSKSQVKIAYTAMHGVGYRYVKRSFQTFGLPHFVEVERQLHPDPEFPTVTFPNPEEGREALDLAIETADKNGCTIILATDPDADRLAVAEKARDGKGWKLFNGNEIGILLASWAWDNFHARHPEIKPEDCCVLTTAVSSSLLSTLARKEGLTFEETLTGFKWLGSVSKRLMNEGKHFVFAYEEAIGFMIGDMSLDKDGVRAAAVFAEMAGQLAKKGMTIQDQLDSLYQRYGYQPTCNRYFFCYDPVTLDKIFTRLREGGNYFKKIGNWNVKNVRDLTIGYDDRCADKKPVLPVSASTQMITYFFENGCIATLRGSGTEPKLKYYIELPGNFSDKAAVDKELAEIVATVIEQCLQPTQNGLTPPNN